MPRKKEKKRRVTPVEQALLDEMGLPDKDRRSVFGVYENPYWYGNSTDWMKAAAGPAAVEDAGPVVRFDFIVLEIGSRILLENSERLREES